MSFDNSVSPWHTVCEVRAPDKPGLLHALASTFAAAAVSVHSARVTTENNIAVDRFELTDRDGHKLDAQHRDAVVAFISGGSVSSKRRIRFGRGPDKARLADPSMVVAPPPP